MAYAQVEPFGNDQRLIDGHFANLMALTANVNRDPKKGRAYKPEDFYLLQMEEKQVGKSPTEIYSIFRTWALVSRKVE